MKVFSFYQKGHKMIKTLVSLVFLVFLSVSPAKASTLDENQCLSYGMTAASISIVEMQGGSKEYILSLLDTFEFKTNPEDIQRLIHVTVAYLTSVGRGQTPEQNFEGASNFCNAAKGDVEKMIEAIQKALGTSI